MFEKNVPKISIQITPGEYGERKEIYVYAKRVIGDLLVMNPVLRKTHSRRPEFWGKMNPVDLLIVGEKSFRIFSGFICRSRRAFLILLLRLHKAKRGFQVL